ncbi:MAG: hypothetical protein Q8O64_20250 [Sideroxyarcus sp.]|nr:hypothetical protein [Sideroxyarcus sp.]
MASTITWLDHDSKAEKGACLHEFGEYCTRRPVLEAWNKLEQGMLH